VAWATAERCREMPVDIMGDDLGDELGDDLGDELGDDLGDDLGDELGDVLVGDDLMGDVDIMGDDLVGDYLIGAPLKRRSKRRLQVQQLRRKASTAQLVRQAMLAKRLKMAKMVHSRGPTKSRIQSIGFTRTAVPANTTVEITARPQVLFRGTRLLVSGSIATNFMIEDIKVGRNSQFVGTGAQPAEAFKDTATGDNVSLDACKAGVDLTLIVTNISGAATDFRASLFGDAIE
jgi:hypothetical protein